MRQPCKTDKPLLTAKKARITRDHEQNDAHLAALYPLETAMRYYTKQLGTNDVQGPFTVEEINARVRSSMVDPKWLATGDIGDTLEDVCQSDDSDWVYLGTVKGVIGLDVPTEKLRRRPWSAIKSVFMLCAAISLIAGAIWFVLFIVNLLNFAQHLH